MNSPASQPSPNERPPLPSLCQSPCPPFHQPVHRRKSRLILAIEERNLVSKRSRVRRTRGDVYRLWMAEGSGKNSRITHHYARRAFAVRYTTDLREAQTTPSKHDPAKYAWRYCRVPRSAHVTIYDQWQCDN